MEHCGFHRCRIVTNCYKALPTVSGVCLIRFAFGSVAASHQLSRSSIWPRVVVIIIPQEEQLLPFSPRFSHAVVVMNLSPPTGPDWIV